MDKIYMTFVQATTGQGGWPLNVFLTPDLKPFFGGTYFPPDNRYGRPGFLQVLQQVQQLWQTRRAELANSAADIHARLEQLSVSNDHLSGLVLTAAVLRDAGALFKQSYDAQHGGFGGAPKFPQPSQPQFLLRYARRFQRRGGRAHGAAHLRPHGRRRHSRSPGRRLRPLLGGCRMAGAALREDALRQRAVGAVVSRRLPGERRGPLRRGGARHPRLRAARHDPSGRRLLLRRGRRQRRARGQVLLLDARRAGEAAHARGVQGGGALLRHHGAGQLR